MDDLGDDADRSDRFSRRRAIICGLAMLQVPAAAGPDAELRWLIAETDTLMRFGPETPPHVREQMIDRTRRWVMRDLRRDGWQDRRANRKARTPCCSTDSEVPRSNNGANATWEAFTLHLLVVCLPRGRARRAAIDPRVRPRCAIAIICCGPRASTPIAIVNERADPLLRGVSRSGRAHWTLARARPRILSFLAGLVSRQPAGRTLAARTARRDSAHRNRRTGTAGGSIDESLELLGVNAASSAKSTSRNAAGAARLGRHGLADGDQRRMDGPSGARRHAGRIRRGAADARAAGAVRRSPARPWAKAATCRDLRSRLRAKAPARRADVGRAAAFLVFQLAQILGWSPADLYPHVEG